VFYALLQASYEAAYKICLIEVGVIHLHKGHQLFKPLDIFSETGLLEMMKVI
jgi:hypothetical protein